jgi:tetratricopeptide (TPR) repeat protein|nr:hypothetical protein [Kofleriaceae bacterium]
MTSLARITIASLLLATVSGAVAHADTPPSNKTQAEAAYADGQREYANKNYKDAADHFRFAYSNDPDPIYMFNAAQAHRLNHDCAAALEEYRTFYNLVKDKQVSGLEKVQKYIDDMTACSKDSLKPEQPTPPPVVQQLPPQQPAQPNPQPAQPGVEGGGSSHVPEIALFAGGAALLAVGVVGTVKVGSIHTDATSFAGSTTCMNEGAAACQSDLDKKFNNDGKTWQDVAAGAYVVGGVAVIAGAALLYLHRGSTSEHVVSAAPTTTGGTVFATWRF